MNTGAAILIPVEGCLLPLMFAAMARSACARGRAADAWGCVGMAVFVAGYVAALIVMVLNT